MNRNGRELVSVVMPAYNHEGYVETAVQSLQGQTHTAVEIVIIDDGSSDNTGGVCARLAAGDSRIRYIRQTNQGAHAAINAGVAASRGTYLAILNSDDIYRPEKIERCLDIVRRNPAIELVAGNIGLIDSQGAPLTQGIEADWIERAYRFFRSSGLLSLSILNENFIATTSNLFFSRDLFSKTGGFQPLRYCHDLDFLTCAFHLAPCHFDSEVRHIHYRVHPGNTIKENLDPIRVEIAAVAAVALVRDNVGLLARVDAQTLAHLKGFLENKDFSNLLIALMIDYIHTGDRTAFYLKLQQPGVIEGYINLLP